MTAPADPQEIFDAALALLSDKRQLFVMEYLKDLNGAAAVRRMGSKARRPDQQAYEYLRIPEIAAAVRAGIALKGMGQDEVLARLADQARGSMGEFLRVDEEDITVELSIALLTEEERFRLAMGGNDAVRLFLARHADMEAQAEDAEGDDAALDGPKAMRIQVATVKRAVARLDLLQAADKLHLIKKYSIDKEGKVVIELYDSTRALELIGKHHGSFVERSEQGKPGDFAPRPKFRDIQVNLPDDSSAGPTLED